MKLGIIQIAPVLGDRAATIARLQPLLDQATDADLIVLPELCNSGYNFSSPTQARELAESAEDGPFVQYLTEYCKLHNTHVVSGLNERDSSYLYNTAVLIGPAGPIGKYRKIHLFWNEKDIFQPGDLGLPLFDIGSARIGMLVCFDWLFPEVWRILALKGADIICHPSNLVLPELCQKAIPTHAVCNRVFVMTANRVGTEGELTFTGRSIIASPKAEVIAEGTSTGEEFISADVDIAMARDKMLTPRNHAFNDRRPECYRELVKK
ncbi:MAG TPA: nitrilase-related carbon-nitrogen hydrolase [candidate division Zixibacteria bacterium]|nr:nitrilase-related carbon-nitrogen hydrolase [candidate division Zixibacteria bacterium]